MLPTGSRLKSNGGGDGGGEQLAARPRTRRRLHRRGGGVASAEHRTQVVRVGDSLTLADAAAGGLDAIRDGTSFAGEGFTVSVAPAAGDAQRRPANVTVTDAAGKTQSYSGNWICS